MSSSDSTALNREDGAKALAPAAVGVTLAPPERRGGAAAYSEDEGVEELAARRAARRTLADAVHQKAEETAQRARSLK